VALERWEIDRVDLAELVRDTLEGTTILARRGIRLLPEVPEDDECHVTGDRRWLQRALDNLIKNSIDALGDRDGEVHVRVMREGELVVLEVEDTAGGIPDSTLQDLFSPHFSTTTSGSGLGLALVHQVVVRCQGRVAAANGVRGLVVRLEFPGTMRP
jgi:signal transduction histidine kinase